MKNFDQNRFMQDIDSQPWFLLEIYDDPNDAMEFVISIFEIVLDRHAPKRTKTFTSAKLVY